MVWVALLTWIVMGTHLFLVLIRPSADGMISPERLALLPKLLEVWGSGFALIIATAR